MTIIIEKANQRTWYPLKTDDVNVPARGAAYIQPETGVAIRRVTDAEYYKTLFPDLKIETTSPNYGITNGYSRFECLSPDGNFLLAFGTTPYAILHSAKSLEPIRVIRSQYTATKKVGDLEELKWNPVDGKLYYVASRKLVRQDAITGTEELVYEWDLPYKHTSDGHFSTDGRRLAMALFSPKNVALGKPDEWFASVIDIVDRRELIRIPYRSPNGVDVSPSGRFLKVDNFYYEISTGMQVGSTQAGHGGWAIDLDGRECFVSQHNSCGWIVAYFPDNKEHRYLQRMPGEDKTPGVAGIHVASDKRGYFKGFAMVSAYGGLSELGNDCYFLELKSQKLPGVLHPSYGGSIEVWNKATVANDFMPNIVRVCDVQNTWAAYFSESFVSVGSNHCCYVGSNWNGMDNLELYQIELTPEILEAVGVTVWPKNFTFRGPGTFTLPLPEGSFNVTVEKAA